MKALLALTCALVLLPAAAAARVEASTRTAILRLADTQPVTLRGSRFLRGERVSVVAVSQVGKRSRTVRASRAGTFLVRLDGLLFDRCEFSAVARGARGSVAMLKLPQPACPPGG